MNNHWIVKPWNLARALDTHVSNSLHHILRVKSSGPKIVQKQVVFSFKFNIEKDERVSFEFNPF